MPETRERVRPTVLVVEDHGDTREMYVEVLSAAGLETIDVETAEEAIRRLEVLTPQIIVADLGLGSGEDGLALCERLKRDPKTKDIPILLVTGYATDKHLQRRAEAAGCALVLIKPVDPFAIVAEILQRLE